MAFFYYCKAEVEDAYLAGEKQRVMQQVNVALGGRWRNLHRSGWRRMFAALVWSLSLVMFAACDVQRRKSDAELGLNPQQIAGRKIYDSYCDRCHEPYSTRRPGSRVAGK